CFDVSLQEDPVPAGLPTPDPSRHAQPARQFPDPAALKRVARQMADSQRLVILAGRLGHTEDAWQKRVELAERLGATVLTDLKQAASFPTNHPLHMPISIGQEGKQALRDADVVLALDCVDPAGTLGNLG